MRSLTSVEQVAAQWQRVRVGYESLAPMPGKWTSMLRRLHLSSAGNVLPRPARAVASKGYLHHLPITRQVMLETSEQ